jgi:hypothetical protein
MTQRVYPGDRRLAAQHLRLGNYERAYELDPSLRSRVTTMAADSAAADAMIDRVISAAIHRETHAAARRSTLRTKPVQKRPARGLTAAQHNSLFQLQPGDPGYQETRGAHALDAAPDEAAQHIRHAINHVSCVASGNAELDAERLRGYLESALECLGGDGADENLDDRDDADEVTEGDKHGGPTRIRARDEDDDDVAGGRWETPGKNPSKELGRDGVGKTPARSAVSLRGADAAPGHYDAGALFQEPKA